mmetsp:Transcript_59713/g.66832  ORF Transcript_59713/g.66832 Transcript_59713/m.66832 type:complete len:170 (-) Transcript_59713:666-1175(-)
MPSANQPWMLQRSKWTTKKILLSTEKYDEIDDNDVCNDDTNNDNDNDNGNKEVSATETIPASSNNNNKKQITMINHWVVTERASDFYKRIIGTEDVDDGDYYDDDDFVIQFGYYYYQRYADTDTDNTRVTTKKETKTKKLRMVARHYSNRNEQNNKNWFNLCGIFYLEG